MISPYEPSVNKAEPFLEPIKVSARGYRPAVFAFTRVVKASPFYPTTPAAVSPS
jgi:hypothetical protein